MGIPIVDGIFWIQVRHKIKFAQVTHEVLLHFLQEPQDVGTQEIFPAKSKLVALVLEHLQCLKQTSQKSFKKI